ncbi:tyrosine-type recombinase/integrase [Halomonas stenophila]|uniref:Type 1 fimbriae regulatory protein FimB/type 1 fimbriae regulatory protein FimE n=1 Tax=Halomonas stenophila TaxID=795312 RepID=A0A7W5ETI5_9GAMM|nr:tyrosine-type recombinase/integrase [Halomonas stenophila]MBB3231066.1 type 1 fimbriae regulatory protein FimB/type 1 fimbriae regulatory protein FimE [Halomonas stenophila]
MSDAALSNVVEMHPSTEKRTVGGSRSANDVERGRKHLTRDEVQALTKAAKQTRNGERDSLMIRLAFEHGLRVSELVGLRWQAFNLDAHEVLITRAKGSLDGTHPLQGQTIRALRRYQRNSGRSHGLVFVSERGAPISVDGFRRMFGRLTERVLGIKWHPHALRHACGVHLINNGTDIRTVQQYMGHANIQNTVAYTALTGRQFEKLSF